MNKVIGFLVSLYVIYQAYGYLFPEVPVCSDEKARATLVEIFIENAEVDPAGISEGSFDHHAEVSYDKEAQVRHCSAGFTLGGQSAMVNYDLTWENRFAHEFLVSVPASSGGLPSGFRLITQVVTCEDEAVRSTLQQIYEASALEAGVSGGLQLSEFQQLVYDAESDRRTCQGLVTADDGSGAAFSYVLSWDDKARGLFTTRILEELEGAAEADATASQGS